MDFRWRGIPGISLRHQRRHVKWLGILAEKRVTGWAGVRRLLDDRRVSRPWRWSTTQTAAGTIVGAVKRADQYGLPCRVPVKVDQAWADWCREVKRQVVKEMDTLEQARPVTARHVDVMLREACTIGDYDLWAFLLLMFALVSRPGCVSMARKSQTEISNDGWLRVRFLEGKGVTMRGTPYTVHSALSTEWAEMFRVWVSSRDYFLFEPASVPKLRQRALVAMRRVHPEYQHYSFRRGGAMHLQAMGASVTEIRQFTGHTTDTMCLRYLEWGWANVAMASRPRELAATMWLSRAERGGSPNC